MGELCRDLAGLGVFNALVSDGRSLFCFCGTRLAWLTRRAPFGPATLLDEDLTIVEVGGVALDRRKREHAHQHDAGHDDRDHQLDQREAALRQRAQNGDVSSPLQAIEASFL